ncbi:MAG: hypothetical protein R3240_13005, partial [Gammaproteobacteria bacterium]|nr:hypothetical protein [Gammaproteobacteria bacterium]
AKYGYRIVNSQGATLQVVPGTLEKQREEKKRLAHKKTKKPHKKEHSKDEYLLRTFVDEEDIRQTGNKKILALQTQIETTNQHISAFEKNLVQLEEQIQTMDQAGKEITDKQVDDIRRIKDSIAKNKAFVLRKIKQQQEIRDEYLGYIERFKALKAQQAKQ